MTRAGHWTEVATRIYDDRYAFVGECPRGLLWVKTWRRWRPLSLWRPTHWLPYVLSRSTKTLAWLDE